MPTHPQPSNLLIFALSRIAQSFSSQRTIEGITFTGKRLGKRVICHWPTSRDNSILTWKTKTRRELLEPKEAEEINLTNLRRTLLKSSWLPNSRNFTIRGKMSANLSLRQKKASQKWKKTKSRPKRRIKISKLWTKTSLLTRRSKLRSRKRLCGSSRKLKSPTRKSRNASQTTCFAKVSNKLTNASLITSKRSPAGKVSWKRPPVVTIPATITSTFRSIFVKTQWNDSLHFRMWCTWAWTLTFQFCLSSAGTSLTTSPETLSYRLDSLMELN